MGLHGVDKYADMFKRLLDSDRGWIAMWQVIDDDGNENPNRFVLLIDSQIEISREERESLRELGFDVTD